MIRLAILSELLGADAGADLYLEPALRVRGELAREGVSFVRDDPDVVLVDSPQIEAAPDHCPLILFDKTDGGMLWWYGSLHDDRTRAWLQSPRVVGTIKLTRYRSKDYYNRPCAEGAWHLHQIHAAAAGAFADTIQPPACDLDDASFGRIEVGYGFWAFAPCMDWELPGLDSPRPLDVFCACSVAYASPAVTYHRHRALDVLADLPCPKQLVRGRTLTLAEYRAAMAAARVCVSPWGWGETTLRDYEAMLAGCVLIKPRTDFIDSIPAVDERHYVACAVDFSDLPERVNHVVTRWDEYADMRRANRQWLLAWQRPTAVARLFAGAVKRLVGRIG